MGEMVKFQGAKSHTHYFRLFVRVNHGYPLHFPSPSVPRLAETFHIHETDPLYTLAICIKVVPYWKRA